jgi:hypothetical protein
MRIGTWNLDSHWSNQHDVLIRQHLCDVWLLTELNSVAVTTDGRVAGYYSHQSARFMNRKQHWAAVLSVQPLDRLDDPHPASAAAVVNGITYCSTILPWAGCRQQQDCPWADGTLAEMVKTTLDCLIGKLPRRMLVWGGDWNQNLAGEWENIGCNEGRSLICSAIESLGLELTTVGLPHQQEERHTIDHIAVPIGWKTKAEHIPAKGLSDHDAYVVTVHES